MYFPNTQQAKEWMYSLLKGLTAPRIGVTSGCFDILHPLHVQYLEKCKARCDFLIVGVDTDRLIEEFKHKVPVFSEHDRAYMVSALNVVDMVFVMDDLGVLSELLSEIRDQYRKDKDTVVELYKAQRSYYNTPVLRVQGVDLIDIPDVFPIHSTTELVQFIQKDYQKL